MKEENRKYAEEAYSIVRHAAEKIGSRLPGSDGERKFADFMGDKLKEIGITPTREEFAVSPRASIGGIPYAGCLVRHGARRHLLPVVACFERIFI